MWMLHKGSQLGRPAVNCDKCYRWYHIDCHNIHTATYSDLGEDDSTGHTGHSSVAWICHVSDSVNYSQHAFQSSIWGIGDISNNQYHPLVDNESDDPALCQQLRLPLYASSPTKLEQKTQEKNCKT